MLYSLAGLLGAAGIGFLVAALIASQDGGSPVRSSVVLPEATASPVSAVEGAQSTPAPDPTPTIAAIPTLPASPTPASTVPATEPPSATSAPTDTPAPAPTPIPPAPPTPAPAPTEARTEEPAPTPSGPFLMITGPATAAVGVQARFSSAVEPAPVTMIWRYLGQQTLHVRFIAVTFPNDGCFLIELAAVYADTTTTTVHQVAVGAGSCP